MFIKIGNGISAISLIAIALLAISVAVPDSSFANVVKVPSGNRNNAQPAVPAGAKSRTRATKGSFEGKFQKIYALLAKDRRLIKKIKKASNRFGIAPIHIIGALVGEHTYNVDALDHLQTYYVKAAAYLGSDLTFKHGREKVVDFVNRPQFAKCQGLSDSYDLWTCREKVWNASFRGKAVGGVKWPNDRMGRVFFQPLYAGQTFGLGQLNPLTALRVTDMVNRVTRARKLNPARAPQVYETIMDPDSTLDYMAAVLRVSIDAYAGLAGFDISGNPGVTATLYNLGDVRGRARKLARTNKGRKASGKKLKLPEENYYGWLVNSKQAELEKLLR